MFALFPIARLMALALALCLFSLSSALASKRIALVIGNSAYAHAPALPNPVNDSTEIARKLEQIGFEIIRADNLEFDGFRRTLRDFSKKAAGADMAVVFYAGHGMEVNKSNYLIPVDAKLETDREISFEAVPLELVMEAVSGAKGLRLVMLDACRNNPFANKIKMTSPTRSIGRGLSFIEPTAGTLVSYAAREGTTAEDGQGKHSPYTTALLENLDLPGLEVNFLFRKVRDSVLENTGGKQEPFTYGSLPGKQIFLVPGEQQPNTALQAKDNLPTSDATDALFWSAIQDSGNPALFEEYLRRFPQGIFSSIAKIRLAALSQPKPADVTQEEPVQEEVAAVGEDHQAVTNEAPTPEQVSRSVIAYDVGRWPEGVTLAQDGLWVAESGRRTIAKLDPDNGKLLRRVQVGRLPVGMITGPTGTVYSLVHTDKALWAQYPSGNGKQVLRIKGSPDRMIRHGEDLWILAWPDGSSGTMQFTRFDMRSGNTQTYRELRKGKDFDSNNREFAISTSGPDNQPVIWTVFGNGLVLALNATDMSRVAWAGFQNTFLSSVQSTNKFIIVTGRDETTRKGIIVLLDPGSGKEIRRHVLPEHVYATTKASGFVLAASSSWIFVLSAVSGDIVREIAMDGPWSGGRNLFATDSALYASQYTNDSDGRVMVIHDWKP